MSNYIISNNNYTLNIFHNRVNACAKIIGFNDDNSINEDNSADKNDSADKNKDKDIDKDEDADKDKDADEDNDKWNNIKDNEWNGI